jgi:hypothetical protein
MQHIQHSEPPSNGPFLPNEIIMAIAGYLQRGHIGNFRLCCRAFAAIALPHMLREVVVFLHAESISRFLAIIRNRVLRQYVRSLHFEMDGLKEPGASFEEYDKEVREFRVRAAGLKHLPELPEGVFNQTLTRGRLMQSYGVYRATVECQNQLRVDFLNKEVWTYVIRALPNLDSVTISSGYHFRSNPFPKCPFRMHCINDGTPMGDCVGVEEFELLLISAGSVKRRLSTLRAGLLHWSAFAGLNVKRLERFVAPLEHLTTLDLVISTGEDESSDEVGTEAEECYWHLSGGGLARFIQGLPNLHCLSVEFDHYDWDSWPAANSETILCADGHWTHLRELSLSCMALEPEHMVAFFKKHQKSLQDLSFTQVSISGSPRSFLSEMHDILSLRTFHVFGNLWASFDDEENEGYEVEEAWFLRWPEQRSLVRNCLETFVIHGGEYPLTMDRVNELEAQDEPDVYALIREGKYKP